MLIFENMKQFLKSFFVNTLPYGTKERPINFLEYLKMAKLELIVLFAILAFDQITKGIVQATMTYNYRGSTAIGTTWIIPNFFGFWYTSNPGGAGGFNFWIDSYAGRLAFFIIFTLIAVTIFAFFMYRFRGEHWLARVTFAMIISGALGNFFDRLFFRNPAGRFGVRDFIQFRIGELDFLFFSNGYFATFNVADMALVGGVITFAVFFIFMYKPAPPPLVGPVMPENWGAENNTNEQTNIPG